MSVLVRQSPKLKLFRWVDGDLVEDQNVHVLSITATSGGHRSYSAKVEITNPDDPWSGIQSTTRYHDRQLLSLTVGEWGWIYLEPTPGADLQLMFIGYVIASPILLSSEGEPELLEIRLDSWHMGQVTKSFYTTHDGTDPVEIEIDLPLVFNPIVDGKIRPNKFEDYLWHPEASPPPGETLESWDAFSALKHLIGKYQYVLGGFDTFDGDFADCAVLDGHIIANVRIDRGLGLAEAIDSLLLPLGYDWSFTPIESDNPLSLHLRVWSIVSGYASLPATVCAMTSFTNQSSMIIAPMVSRIQGSVDLVSGSANRFIILGDFIRKEGTFELIPAWDESLEGQDIARYQMDSEYWLTDARYSRVHRDYVLNEAGNYSGTQFDVAAFFGSEQTNRPRRFYPCLSLGDDGKPFGREKGYHLEEFDGLNWIPFTDPMNVMSTECGIRITRTTLSFFHLKPASGNDRLRLRITATLESDHRLTIDSGLLPSNLPEEKLMVIDTEHRFKKQTRDAGSVLSALPSEAVDDTATATLYMDQVKQSFSKHAMELAVTLNRIDLNPSLLLGQRVEAIGSHTGGRQLGLVSNAEETSYPIITAVVIDVQEQTTTLMLDGKTR